jgi:hypothetical protein
MPSLSFQSDSVTLPCLYFLLFFEGTGSRPGRQRVKTARLRASQNPSCVENLLGQKQYLGWEQGTHCEQQGPGLLQPTQALAEGLVLPWLPPGPAS